MNKWRFGGSEVIGGINKQNIFQFLLTIMLNLLVFTKYEYDIFKRTHIVEHKSKPAALVKW